LAQSPETHYFKAKLSTDNENPVITGLNAYATARFKVSVTRDNGGAITSGTVTFNVGYQFPGPVTLVGMHIHAGGVGENGPVVISSGLTTVDSPTGTGSLFYTTGDLTTQTQLQALDGLIKTPQLYYVNLHTPEHPAGVIRGQITTETFYFKALMLPENESPAITDLNADAPVLVTLDVTRDDSGNITSGAVVFDAQYRFPGAVNIVGFHIHSGQFDQNGPVVISSGIESISDPTGTGQIVKVLSLPTTDTMLGTIRDLVANPGNFYVNIHTPEHPAGAMRGQLTEARQALSLPYSVDNATYRSNLGIQNLSDIPGMVLARLTTSSGEPYEKTIYLPSRGLVQIYNVNPAMGSDEDTGSIWLAADQPIEAFVSVIQNSNNAPILVPLAFSGRRLSITSATNAGSFRSTLVVANQGSGTAVVDVVSRDLKGNVVGQKTGIQIAPMGFFSDTDILTSLGLSGSYGPLEIRSTNGQPVTAVSIVHNASNNLGSSLVGREF
jgi:hypothetical protein